MSEVASRPAFGGRIYFGWYLVGAAAVAQFASAAVQAYVAGVFVVPMTEELGWTRSEFTLALTIGQVTLGIIGFWIGAQVDRRGGRNLMLAGALIAAMSMMLTSQVTELWQWLLLRGVLVVVGTALFGNLVVNVTVSKWFVERRGRAIGLAGAGISTAGVIGPPVMTAVVDAFGWRAGWQVLAVVTVLLIVPAAFLMRRQPEDYGLQPDGRTDADVGAGAGARAAADFATSLNRFEALRTSALYIIIIAFGLASFSVVAFLLQAIPFLTDAGYSRATASFMVAVYALPSAATKPFWGYAAERIHPRHLTSLCWALHAIGLMGALFAVNQQFDALLLVSFFIMGVGQGGHFPLSEFIWATYFGRRYLGAVRGMAMPPSILFSAGGPIAVALYFDRVGNYDGAFVAMALLWVAAGMLVQLAREPAKRRAPVDEPRR